MERQRKLEERERVGGKHYEWKLALKCFVPFVIFETTAKRHLILGVFELNTDKIFSAFYSGICAN